MSEYSKLSRKFFSKYAKSIVPYAGSIKKDIKAGNLSYTLEEYISMTIMTVFIMFFLEAVVFSVVFSLILRNIILGLISALFFSFFITGIVVFAFYIYPTSKASGRKKETEKGLPFAAAYLSAISSGNVEPSVIFRTLSQFKDYGQVSKDSENIARNIDVFGMTAGEAIKHEAEKTPSKDLKDLLYGINTTMASGGNLTNYLEGKTNDLMSNHRRKIRKYAQTLSIFVEVYLTLLVGGSVFFIVLSSIMSVISGGLETVVIQTFVVFILLPMISSGFIILIKAVSPSG